MEKLTAQLETRWTSHLGSVGGEIFLLFLSHHPMFHCRHRFGRICPGKHLAQSTLTLTAASVLSTFDLVRKVDENGLEIVPEREYTKSGGIRSVFHFLNLGFSCLLKCHFIDSHLTFLAWSSRGLMMLWSLSALSRGQTWSSSSIPYLIFRPSIMYLMLRYLPEQTWIRMIDELRDNKWSKRRG